MSLSETEDLVGCDTVPLSEAEDLVSCDSVIEQGRGSCGL